MFSSTITTKSALVTSLTPGVTYDFYVEARNLIGYSPVSTTQSILAAQVPDAPISLSDVKAVTKSTQIGLTWTAATFNGGSPVIDYTVIYDNASAGVTFTQLVSGLT